MPIDIGPDGRARQVFTGPISDDERRLLAPRPGTRCPRCHRKAPRADGIPCALCAPGDYSPEAAQKRHEEAIAAVNAAGVQLFVDALVRMAHRAGGNQK